MTITQNVMLLPENQPAPAKVATAKDALASRFAFVEEGRSGRSTLIGDDFSGADVVVGHSIVWANRVGALTDNPKLQAYLGDLSKRPAYPATYGG